MDPRVRIPIEALRRAIEAVVERLGEEGVKRLVERLAEEGVKQLAAMHGQLQRLSERATRLEEGLSDQDQRMSRLEEGHNAQDRKIEQVRQELRQEMRQDTAQLRSQIVQLREDSKRQFLLFLGVQITMWVTIILAILIWVR